MRSLRRSVRVVAFAAFWAGCIILTVIEAESHLAWNGDHVAHVVGLSGVSRSQTPLIDAPNFQTNSPYQLRQPHSLPDFLQQVHWVEEARRIRTEVSRQQATIEKRYDDDDPELEQKLRSADPDCVGSKSLELNSENFIGKYPVDYMLRVYGRDTVDVQESLRPETLQALFGVEVSDTEREGDYQQPQCSNYLSDDAEELLSGTAAERELAPRGRVMFDLLARYISARMATSVSRPLALYYASFYWRLRGDREAAHKCLLAYLQTEPESTAHIAAAKLQMGILHLKAGKYQKAIGLLVEATEHINPDACNECFVALGDAHTLEGNFADAVAAYERSGGSDVEEKRALLKCTMKLFEAMEKQHTHLLETIDDVEDYRAKTAKLKQLEQWIEANRASPESRLQAKLAYEHLSIGPIPHLSCRGMPIWVNKKEQHQRLHCTVDNWDAFNESLVEKYKQLIDAEDLNNEKGSRNNGTKSRVELLEIEKREVKQKYDTQMSAYLEKLKPFVGMKIDEPPLAPLYPLKRPPAHARHRERLWPSDEECQREGNESDEPPQLFLPPENKGFTTVDLLTKFLAIADGDASPPPWTAPYCVRNNGSTTNTSDFMAKFPSVQRLKSARVDYARSSETRLVDAIKALVPHQTIPLGDFGNRIALLMKYNVGPVWLSANLAALYFRYFGSVSNAVNCLELALESVYYKDIAFTQLAQVLITSSTSLEDVSGEVEELLKLALAEGPHEIHALQPLPHLLLGRLYQLGDMSGKSQLAEEHFIATLEIDSDYKPAVSALLGMKCRRRKAVHLLPHNIRHEHAPVCCWPNEQNIYCFRTQQGSDCFRMQVAAKPPYNYHFVHFRCNTPYTGQSQVAPPYAFIIAPLLKPAAELRQAELEQKVQRLIAEELRSIAGKRNEVPVLPLDYGGYSEERIRAHQRQVLPDNFDKYQQFAVVYEDGPTEDGIDSGGDDDDDDDDDAGDAAGNNQKTQADS